MKKIEIKSLADFKKTIKVGMKIHTIWHQWKWTTGENGYCIFEEKVSESREISIIKSNQFAIKTPKSDGTFVDSWMLHPKASECTIKDNSITINYETTINANTREKKIIPFMTYFLIAE